MPKVNKTGKVIASKKVTAEALFSRVFPTKKISAATLFLKARQMLEAYGKRPVTIRHTPAERIRAKKERALPTGFVDTRKKKIFPSGIKPLTTHEKTFLRRYLTGGEEDPNDIIWIHLSEKGLKFFSDMQNKALIRKSIDEVAVQMRRIYNSLIAYAAKEIGKYVPKDTGTLRWSLLMSLNKRLSLVPKAKPPGVGDLILRMSMYTDLHYLQYVNAPAKGRNIRIAHHRSMRIRSKKTGEYLHDPDAKFGFMSLIRMHLKNRARSLTRSMLSTLATRWGMGYSEVKGLFRYRGYKFR